MYKNLIGVILIFMVFGCVHNEEPQIHDVKEVDTVKDQPLEFEESPETYTATSVMQVEESNPNAVKVMQEECDGRYEVVDESENRSKPKSQVEMGLTKSVGNGDEKAKAIPYIKYRCLRN